MLIRIGFILILMYSYRFFKGWRLLCPCDKTLFEISKYLIMPLTLQTLIECLWVKNPNYLPARFCMLLIGIGCLAILYLLFHFLNFPLSIILVMTTILSFLFEKDYLTKPYCYQPYDNFFAILGILFIILIVMLNTYTKKTIPKNG